MNYKVEFETDGNADSISYTVKAENVLDAEEAAKKKLKNNIAARTIRVLGKSWRVKQIENISEHGNP